MKKIFTVIAVTLALNFLAAAGGLGWLYQSGKLTKEKIGKIRELVFAPPPTPPAAAASANAPATRPYLSLEDLLAKKAGRSASEQVDFIQRTFDAQMLELDRRQSDLQDLKQQVDLANQKLASDRKALEDQKQALAHQEDQAQQLLTDKGFQDSLALYNTMPSKQVKTIFLTLHEHVVQQYLEAMQPRNAAKIIKEFKTPDEIAFIQKVLENMRLAQQSQTPSGEQAQASAAQPK